MSVVLEPAPRDPAQRFWDAAAQTMDPERRRELQDQRLREMIGRVFSRPVPMFERRLRDAGVEGPDDIRGVDDLDRLPLTVKQHLRDSETAAPPVGDYRFTELRDCIRIGSSTGTTGAPTLMLWTWRDLHVEYESAARNWWRAGIRPGMVVTHAHPAYLYGGGLNLQSTYEYVGALPIWVPPPDTDELAEQGLRMWQRITPDVPFVGFSLGRFLEVQAKLGIDPQTTGVRIPEIPAGPSAIATAGAECFSFLAGSCAEHNGGHIADDYACVQAVDPSTGHEVPECEWGDLVVTTFGRDNCMIRYDLEEACRIERSVCACGETTSRGWWGGRFKDLIATQGRRLQIFDVERALRGVAEVVTPSLEYAVVRPREESAPLQVRVECSSEADGAGARCVVALREGLDIESQVSIVERGSLPRSGYKRIRVVDE